MDEPTAALSRPRGGATSSGSSAGLRERGVAVVFISHRLEEVGSISDVVTVLT